MVAIGSVQQKGPIMQPETETMSGPSSELASNAKQIGSSAVNRAHSEVDARKGEAASQARSVSSAIERAADGLDESAPAWLRSAFQQGAQQVQRLADTIEQKDSRQLVKDVSDFARNSPGTFLAGCAAVGFAAARIFKAGAEPSGASDASYDAQSGFAAENYSSEVGTGTGSTFAPGSLNRGDLE